MSLVTSKYIFNTYPYFQYVWIQKTKLWVFVFRKKINLYLCQVYFVKLSFSPFPFVWFCSWVYLKNFFLRFSTYWNLSFHLHQKFFTSKYVAHWDTSLTFYSYHNYWSEKDQIYWKCCLIIFYFSYSIRTIII